jgi:hypothetical protein
MMHLRTMMHAKLKTFPAAAALALAVCAGAWAQTAGQALPPWSPGTLDIHRISTGKGDAVLYIFPDGTTMLVDPGATGRQGPRVTAQRPDASRTPGEWVTRYIRRMLPAGSPPALGTPRRLFEFDTRELCFYCDPMRCYDVAPDGERFYVVAWRTPRTPPLVTHINLVQNWFEELNAKAPGKR